MSNRQGEDDAVWSKDEEGNCSHVSTGYKFEAACKLEGP
jgi:hypothetical protein